MKPWVKLLCILIGAMAIAGILWIGNAFLGNPVSHTLAVRSAEEYLLEHFPGRDFQMERVGYNLKNGDYYAIIASPSSVDTHFTVYFDGLGKYKYDTYDSVLDGWNTAQRLELEYRQLTDQVFNDPSLPYDNQSIYSIMFGRLEISPKFLIDDPAYNDIPDYAIVQDELIIDQQYDIRSLGAQAGHLIIYADSDTLSAEEAARIMLDFKDRFDQAGIPFYAMEFCLRYPVQEDGTRKAGSYDVGTVLYRDIYEEGLTQRIILAHEATVARYAAIDAK